MDRRQFVGAGVIASMEASAFGRALGAPDATPRKRIAFLGTEVRRHSHAQHFLDRLGMGYTWRGKWRAPRLDIAAVYIDQFPKGDLAKERIAKYKLNQPTWAGGVSFGPHNSTAGDMVEGVNAITYGKTIPSGSHSASQNHR